MARITSPAAGGTAFFGWFQDAGSLRSSRSGITTRAVILILAIAALVVTFRLASIGRPDGSVVRTDLRHPTTGDRTLVVRTGPNLPDRASADRLAARLAARGVARVFVQFKQDETAEVEGGRAFYPSAIAPVASGFEDDRLGAFVEALARHGIEPCAWVPCFHDPVAAAAHPDRRAWWIRPDGVAEDQVYWLCPRNEDAVAYEASILAEIAARYPRLESIYTDFIRYDSDHSCVCDRCLGAIDDLTRWTARHGRALGVDDLVAAGEMHSGLWRRWTAMRAASICDAVDAMRAAIEEVRPDLWFGACVLPFSATDYALNTQSGQDLFEMARRGLDEIVLMGYWDDWDRNPQWLTDSLQQGEALVRDECRLTCLIDGDMSVRRTWVTLDAVAAAPDIPFGYFHYGEWTDERLDVLDRAEAMSRRFGGRPSVDTAVVIRIDTEPDASGSYDAVTPDMIRRLMDLLEAEGVRGTFITCGALAERQPEVMREIVARGHEVGGHAYDHEQIDALPLEAQAPVIDRMFAAFDRIGIDLVGFGAPRNSITPAARDRLIEAGLRYDGSAAYDPMEGYLDPVFETRTTGDSERILVIPFIMPNDWDARQVWQVSAAEMLGMWTARLERVRAMGEPCFVLDVHQWIASRPDNFDALRAFIRFARSTGGCRFMTLADAATHVERFLDDLDARAGRDADGYARRDDAAARREARDG